MSGRGTGRRGTGRRGSGRSGSSRGWGGGLGGGWNTGSGRSAAYYANLASPHWKQVRHEAIMRAGGRCERCGSFETLDGHHAEGYGNLGHETASEIQALCRSCHDLVHGQISIGGFGLTTPRRSPRAQYYYNLYETWGNGAHTAFWLLLFASISMYFVILYVYSVLSSK